MAIGGLGGGLLAGLSGIAQGLQEAQKQRERQQLMQMRQAQLKRQMQEDEASSGLYGSILGGLGDVTGGSALTNPMMAGPQAPMPGQGSTAYSPTPQGSGMSSGLSNPLALIAKYESGDRNIEQGVVGPQGGYNPSVGRVTGPSSAGGYFQMIDSTWRDAANKVDPSIAQRWPRAIMAPKEVQTLVAQKLYDEQGMRPWAPYNANLRAALGRGEGGGPAQPQMAPEPQQPPETMLRGGGAPPVAPPGAGGDTGADLAAAGMSPEMLRRYLARPAPGGTPSAGANEYTGMSKPGRAYIPFMGGDIPAGSSGTGQAAPPQPSGGPGAVSETGIALPGDGQRPAAPQAQQQAPAAMPRLMATAPPPVQQQVQQGAVQTAQAIPQAAWGKMSLPALAQQIEKNNPGASGVVKMMMLEKAQKLMAPMELRSWEMFKMQHQDTIHAADQAFQRETLLLQEQIAGRRADRSEAHSELMQQRGFDHTDATGGQLVRGQGPDGNEVLGRIDKNNRFVPVDTGGVTGVQPLSGTGSSQKASTNIRITAEDGTQVFSGAAREERGTSGESNWIDTKTNQRIQVPPGADITITGKGDPGKQAAGQMLRLTVAANEARRQIGNVARTSLGTTKSWFQGLQSEPGKGLVEGLGRTLANEITPRDAQFMSTLGRGLSRSLASLETAGAATGMVGLTQTMEGLIPAKGDTVETSLLKIAEMRQIAEQAIESASVSPAVAQAPQMRKLLGQIKEDIAKAVPYTVAQVLEMVQDPSEQTYGDFARSIGLGVPGGGAPIKVDADGNRIP